MSAEENLWKNGYVQIPCDVLGWCMHEAKSMYEIRIVIYVARLSCGFHRGITNKRLSQKDFANAAGCDPATISRVLGRLLSVGRMFRCDPQGDYFFYSLRGAGARLAESSDCASAIPFGANATKDRIDAMSGKEQIARMQGEEGPAMRGLNTAYMHVRETSAKISLKIPLNGGRLFEYIKPGDWDFLEKKYENCWLNERLESYAKRLTKGSVTFDRLKGFLADDWTKTKPAKDYRRESDESERKRREWEEVQKREANLPDPPELVAYRAERARKAMVPQTVSIL